MAVKKSSALWDCMTAALSMFFTSKFTEGSILVRFGLVRDTVVRVGLVGLGFICRYSFWRDSQNLTLYAGQHLAVAGCCPLQFRHLGV